MNYLTCFENALELYASQTQRSGYLFGFFSSFRHSQKMYPHIQQLFDDLSSNQASEEASKEIIKTYLKSSKTKFNNHSFGLYFLDQLVAQFPGEWDEYYPQEKKIVFYNGLLYRGTLQEPEDAFENGIIGSRSQRIEDYAYHTNMHVGVSTSKDQKVAKRYQHTTFLTNHSAIRQLGYLYKINYRGIGGIDIVDTLVARGKAVTADIASHKDEVNIIGKIEPSDIIGYWDKQGKYHNNLSYQKDKSLQNVNIVDRMKKLF